MPFELQFSLLVASILTFLIIIRNIRKSKLSTDLATVWILWGAGLIFLSLFPSIAYALGHAIGIMSPVNGVFLIMIFLLYVLVFVLYLRLSVLEEKTKNLIHVIALMRKEAEDGKNN